MKSFMMAPELADVPLAPSVTNRQVFRLIVREPPRPHRVAPSQGRIVSKSRHLMAPMAYATRCQRITATALCGIHTRFHDRFIPILASLGACWNTLFRARTCWAGEDSDSASCTRTGRTSQDVGFEDLPVRCAAAGTWYFSTLLNTAQRKLTVISGETAEVARSTWASKVPP